MTAEPRTAPQAADARPVIVADAGRHLLEGCRCETCRHPMARRQPRCSRCGMATAPARFGPAGQLWAVTVLHVAARPGEPLPVTLGYVDLDDGPRLLARIEGHGMTPRVGHRVALAPSTPAGDPAAETVG